MSQEVLQLMSFLAQILDYRGSSTRLESRAFQKSCEVTLARCKLKIPFDAYLQTYYTVLHYTATVATILQLFNCIYHSYLSASRLEFLTPETSQDINSCQNDSDLILTLIKKPQFINQIEQPTQHLHLRSPCKNGN